MLYGCKSSKYDTKFPYQSRIAVRAIRMLGDYQLYGIILRKRKHQQPDPPEEFLKSIREFVSYSYNECGNAASTVNRKVFIIRYFLEIMVSYNLKNCNEMRKNHIFNWQTNRIEFSQYKTKQLARLTHEYFP